MFLNEDGNSPKCFAFSMCIIFGFDSTSSINHYLERLPPFIPMFETLYNTTRQQMQQRSWSHRNMWMVFSGN